MSTPPENHSLISVLFVLCVLALTIIVAYLVGVQRGHAGTQAEQRFTPGVEVPPGAEPPVEKHPAPALEPPAPLRAKPAEPAEDAETESQRAIREALGAATTEAGLAHLETAVASSGITDDDRSRLYSAMARMCDSLSAPDPERQTRYCSLAASLAQSPGAVSEAARSEAEALLGRKDEAGAAKRLQSALDDLPEHSPERSELGVVLGNVLERLGDTAGAELAFNKALDDARGMSREDTERAPSIRQAALRLSHLYRQTGREKEADALAKRVNVEVGQQ